MRTQLVPAFAKPVRGMDNPAKKIRCKSQIIPNRTQSRNISGLKDIIMDYKGIFLDQFGVLHDGQVPYPGAVDCVRHMHKAGLKIILLSNSSQRAVKSYERLEKMGFQREWISGIVTSGEVTHVHLRDKPNSFWKSLGCKILHFTWASRSKISLDNLGLEVVGKPRDADFILAHGTDSLGQQDGDPIAIEFDDMKAILAECAKEDRDIPLVIANPDVVTVDRAALRLMPGALGKEYEKLGGSVVWMGKPAPIIYETALELIDLRPEQIVAIGDSLDHDINGARDANIDSVFICGGIHAGEVNLAGDAFSQQKLDLLCERHKSLPTYVAPYFRL